MASDSSTGIVQTLMGAIAWGDCWVRWLLRWLQMGPVVGKRQSEGGGGGGSRWPWALGGAWSGDRRQIPAPVVSKPPSSPPLSPAHPPSPPPLHPSPPRPISLASFSSSLILSCHPRLPSQPSIASSRSLLSLLNDPTTSVSVAPSPSLDGHPRSNQRRQDLSYVPFPPNVRPSIPRPPPPSLPASSALKITHRMHRTPPLPLPIHECTPCAHIYSLSLSPFSQPSTILARSSRLSPPTASQARPVISSTPIAKSSAMVPSVSSSRQSSSRTQTPSMTSPSRRSCRTRGSRHALLPLCLLTRLTSHFRPHPEP